MVNYVTITKLTEELNKKADAQHAHDYIPLYGGASVYGWLTFEDGGVNAQYINVNGEPVAVQSDIPTKTSDLTNDSNFATTNQLFSKNYNDLTNKPTKVSDFTNDSGFITSSSLPTKTSDLTNDSGFITSNSLPTKISDLTNDSGFITSASLPTKTSELTNDSGFVYQADTIKKYNIELSGNPADFGRQILTEFINGNITHTNFFVND